MPYPKVLVANRGEIALRVFRTCRELDIATVAVAPADDARALHARSADETVPIDSYLDPAEHVRAARESGAAAVHPGYGFLAESAAFADAVEAAGLAWIGPPAEALRAGGDKVAAKETARRAGVPVLPEGEPGEVGFPLLVKAAAGGGGRGMRIVREAGDLDEAVAAARREAAAAFGDDRVYLERLLERPRHVEVQVLADAQGHVVALGERDCSVQRRHQKVLEESPSPGIDPLRRRRLAEAAVAFAHAVGYRNAGTVEFLVEGDEFFFLELNGRIQVEHPVTELVTGLDLVAEQLRLAAGDPVPQAVEARGHAVEVRLYAEDPRTFLPQAGRIERLRLPSGIRVDAGVAEGDEVGTRYDPMIAKLVAAGEVRAEALEHLASALEETEVGGLTTNLPFLRWLVAHPALRTGETTTAFLDEWPPLSQPPVRLPQGPWADGWRLNLPPAPRRPAPDVDSAAHGGGAGAAGESTVTAPMAGTVIRVLTAPGARVEARQPLVLLEAMKMETPVVAPYDGTVGAVHVEEGARVDGGAVLVELEPPA